MRTWILGAMVTVPLLAAGVSGMRAAEKESAISLGDAAEISLSAPDVKVSAEFYEKLGFKRTGARRPGEGVVLTDGIVTVGLYAAKFPSPTLTYFSKDPAVVAEGMKGQGIQVTRLSNKDGRGVAEFHDPSGLRVVLAPVEGVDLPAALPRLNGGLPKGSIVSCGTLAEFCVKVASVKDAQHFWEGLGLKRLGGADGKEAYAIMSDGKSIIGLHQTEEFQDPHLTYFNADPGATIRSLRAAGFTFARQMKNEKGMVIGAALKGPEGQGLFVF